MKPIYKLLLSGCIVIALYDVLGSIISKQFNFNYAYLSLGSLFIYGLGGYWGTRTNNLKNGVLVAGCIGLFDSFVGWKISMLLHANTGSIKNTPTTLVWIISIIVLIGFATLCGLLGGLIANLFKKKLVNT